MFCKSCIDNLIGKKRTKSDWKKNQKNSHYVSQIIQTPKKYNVIMVVHFYIDLASHSVIFMSVIPFFALYSCSFKQTSVFLYEASVYVYITCDTLGSFLGSYSLINDFELLRSEVAYLFVLAVEIYHVSFTTEENNDRRSWFRWCMMNKVNLVSVRTSNVCHDYKLLNKLYAVSPLLIWDPGNFYHP